MDSQKVICWHQAVVRVYQRAEREETSRVKVIAVSYIEEQPMEGFIGSKMTGQQVLSVAGIQRSFYCMGHKDGSGDPMIISSVASSKRAVAGMALRQGGYLHATGSSCWL